jgi:solute carrier family 25 oxoglutarate transporter 11
MAQKTDPLTGKLPYSGVTDCAVQILKKDGPRGFFSGFSAYYVRCAQNSLVLFLVKESIASGYRKAWGY